MRPLLASKEEIQSALTKFDGDRAKAAKYLGVSMRTLVRNIQSNGLYDWMDKRWPGRHRGPPRKDELGVIQTVVSQYIQRHRGVVDYGELTKYVFGEDGPKLRTKVMDVMSKMLAAGMLRVDGTKWIVLT